MTQRYLLILLTFFMTSCATVLTRRSYDLQILSNTPNAQAQIYDHVYNLPAMVKVKRSKNDLKIKLLSDTLTKEFIIKSSPNPTAVYGNLFGTYLFPIGYLIDYGTKKGFYYGKYLYLDKDDTSAFIRPPLLKKYHDYFSKSFPTNKRQINFTFSLPYINSFYLQPKGETSKSNTGFWGISTGIEYYYKDSKYTSLKINAVSDFFAPIPAAIDISGEYELMSSLYLSITDNFKFNRFTLGYGLNYSRNTWDFKYYDRFDPPAPTRDPVKKTSQSFGITIDGYHQFGEHFFVGLIYRPTFVKIYPNVGFEYEHLISLDFAWKIRFKK